MTVTINRINDLRVLWDYQTFRDFKGWGSVFGNDHTLKVEIGCGKDDSLIQRALLEPETNFIGIENDPGIAFRFEKKVRRSQVNNLRIILFEAQLALEVIEQAGGFLNCAGEEIFEVEKPYPVFTLYEKKFLSQGLPIYYLRFRR